MFNKPPLGSEAGLLNKSSFLAAAFCATEVQLGCSTNPPQPLTKMAVPKIKINFFNRLRFFKMLLIINYLPLQILAIKYYV
jgi:hypothetical protein